MRSQPQAEVLLKLKTTTSDVLQELLMWLRCSLLH